MAGTPVATTTATSRGCCHRGVATAPVPGPGRGRTDATMASMDLTDYVDWAEQVVAGCRSVNPALDRMFDDTIKLARSCP